MKTDGIDSDGVGGSNAIFQSVDASRVTTSTGGQTWWYSGIGRYVYNDPFIGGPYSTLEQVRWDVDLKGDGLGPNPVEQMTMRFAVQTPGGDVWVGTTGAFMDNTYQTFGGPLTGFTPQNRAGGVLSTPDGFNGATGFIAQFDYNAGAWGNDADNKFHIDNYRISTVRPNWKGASGGEYSNAANWSENYVPNSDIDFPVFRTPAVPGTEQTVTVNSAVLVNRLDFNSLDNYTLAGAGSITIQGDSPGAFLHEGSDATHTIAVPVTINKATSGIRVNAGNGHLNFDGGLTSTGVIGKDRNGFMSAKFIRAAGLNILGGEVALKAGQTTTSRVGSLTFTAAADGAEHLELNDGRLIVDYDGTSPLPALKTALSQNKIRSTALSANTAIVVAEASEFTGLGSFGDLTPDASSILILVTLKGDTDLTRSVNFDDLLSLAQNYAQPGIRTWRQGDTNADGTVNFDDLLALAQNYGSSLSTGQAQLLDAAAGAGFSSDFALAQSLVPEPTSAVAALAAGGSLMTRRRRRRRD